VEAFSPVRRIRFLALLLALLGRPVPAGAQVQYGMDVGLRSRYEWRGLTRGSGWALQPDLFVGLGRDPQVTVGVWTNVQLASTDPDTGLGFEQQWFGETDLWGEVSVMLGPLEVGGGWNGLFFDAGGAVSPGGSLENTHEIYGRARLLSLPVIVPRLALYYDVDTVDGAYLEAGVSLRIPGWGGVVFPVGSLFFNGVAGFSLGQELDGASLEGGYYADGGLTHLDFSISLPAQYLSLGPVSLAPWAEMHFQFNRDDMTRRKDATGDTDGFTTWLALGITLLGPRCRPERDICRGGE
jgi:hypothetical protein